MSKEGYKFATFLEQHKAQLDASGVPPELWHGLYKKLLSEIFDAGEHFQIVCEEDDGDEPKRTTSVIALGDLHNVDEDNIWLIDHCLTFVPEVVRKLILSVPNLKERLIGLFELDKAIADIDDNASEPDDEVTNEQNEKDKFEEKSKASGDAGTPLPRLESVDARLNLKDSASEDPEVDVIYRELWKYAQTYTVKNEEENGAPTPVWYLMDEFGSKIGHSASPNCRIVPLLYVPGNVAYSILFLTKPVEEREEIVRDYSNSTLSLQKPEWKDLLQLPWVPKDFSTGSTKNLEPSKEFFTSQRSSDQLPTLEQQEISESAIATSLKSTKARTLKIYATDDQLVRFLNRPYELVDDIKKADVVWQLRHFNKYQELSDENPCAQVNQFPLEQCLTVKDLFSSLAMQSIQKNGGAEWYQRTFNLNTELPQFVAYYQQKAKKGENNVWIIKPWNLARGMDMHVTDNINQIIRLIESGPKIACEYIHRPLLFPRPDNGNRVKFDLRFIVFVNKFRPTLEAYVYNKFWIRFAVNEFDLNHLDEMETHFTVFNYVSGGNRVLQMQCEEFVSTVEQTYPNLKWDGISAQINEVLKKGLETASANPPPLGVASNSQSRAMYGADIMLKWNEKEQIEPVLLEYNFMPDCLRACDYYKDFADTVFNTMFLDEIDTKKVTKL